MNALFYYTLKYLAIDFSLTFLFGNLFPLDIVEAERIKNRQFW